MYEEALSPIPPEAINLPVERIYRPSVMDWEAPARLGLDSRSIVYHKRPHPWTEEFADLIAKETEYHPLKLPLPLTAKQIEQIAKGTIKCPYCEGTKDIYLRSMGIHTKIYVDFEFPCECVRPVRLYQLWNRPGVVQDRFRDVRLDDTLQPSEKIADRVSMSGQASAIQFLRDHPNDSYFLHGRPGTGKTHLMTALFRHALERSLDEEERLRGCRTALFRVNTAVLLDEIRQYSLRGFGDDDRTPEPSVTSKKLQWAIDDGYRPALFLDEFDKVKPTDFVLFELIKLIDLVWGAKGQLVATSNKSPEDLAVKWDPDGAATMTRRIGEGDGAHTVGLGAPAIPSNCRRNP